MTRNNPVKGSAQSPRIAIRGYSTLSAWLAVCMLAVASAGAAPATSNARGPTTVPATATAQVSPAAARGASSSPAPTSRPANTLTSAPQIPLRRGPAQTQPTREGTNKAAAQQPAAPGFGFARVLGALAVVLTLIFSLRWLLRRSLQSGPAAGATGAMQVLSRSPLSPRQHLVLLRVGRRLIVAADCNGQLSSLSEITDPDEVAALVGQLRDEKLTAASKSFGNLLGRWRRAEEQTDPDAEEFPRVPPDVYDATYERGPGGEDASAANARGDLNGLVERVRLISQQFKKS